MKLIRRVERPGHIGLFLPMKQFVSASWAACTQSQGEDTRDILPYPPNTGDLDPASRYLSFCIMPLPKFQTHLHTDFINFCWNHTGYNTEFSPKYLSLNVNISEVYDG